MTAAVDFLTGQEKWHVEQGEVPAALKQLPDRSVDMCLFSPPYLEARMYKEDGKNLGIMRKCEAWVEWMIDVIAECHRVTKGPVFCVCAGSTKKFNYQPGPEGLLYEWWKRGGDCQVYRPCFYHRVGIPGSGGKDFLRGDVEYILCFKHAGILPFADNTACGHPPKWAPGGAMSHRMTDGTRVNQWGKTGDTSEQDAQRRQNGERQSAERPSHETVTVAEGKKRLGSQNLKGSLPPTSPSEGAGGRRVTRGHKEGDTQNSDSYTPPVKANPGNVQEQTYTFTATELADLLAAAEMGNWKHCKVGGNLLGHELAHSNEAPYPLTLCEWLVLPFCPPGGVVLDPMMGSGTTGHACLKHGRRFLGFDLRESQCTLSRRRLESVTPGLFA